MKTVLITGAGGFIARNLAESLRRRGFNPLGVSRKPGPIGGFQKIYVGLLGQPLGEPFQKHEIDAVIHCAYDKKDRKQSLNEGGTLAWAEEAERNRVGLQIFMSSISSSEDAVSAYGQSKFRLERWFLSRRHIVFRLGLVVGDGGVFKRMADTVRRYPVVPVIGGSKTMVHLTDLSTLGKIVGDCLENEEKVGRDRPWNLHQEPPVRMKDVLTIIRKKYRCSCILVPVPFLLVSFFLSFVQKLPLIESSFDTDNIKGLLFSSKRRIPSDLARFGCSGKKLEEFLSE